MQTNSLNKIRTAADTAVSPVVNSARRVWLASLGAASLTGREASRIFGRLVDEGVDFENKSREMIKRTRDEAEKKISGVKGRLVRTAGRAKSVVENRIQDAVEPVVYHLVPDGENWAVRREGIDADISVHTTKQAALKAARGVAQAHEPSRLVIHRSDGTIQSSHEYGQD